VIAAEFEFKPNKHVSAALKQAQLKGLRLGGELVLEASNRLVPLEEGTLERSGRVTDNGADTVAISYDTPYARRQHEDMNLRHPNGRQAKFLETAMGQCRAKIAKILQTALLQKIN
jgi:hypothetical protein